MATSTVQHLNDTSPAYSTEGHQYPVDGPVKATVSDLRYERKFAIRDLHPKEIAFILKSNPAFFSSIYQPRFVNNIYLDTPFRHAYHSNVAGSAHRQKVRIRWYGDLRGRIEKPVLEFKVKKGLAGYKISAPLPSFALGTSFSKSDLLQLLGRSSLSVDLKSQVKELEPALINRYARAYLRTADKKFRSTIDSDLSFYPTTQTAHRGHTFAREELTVLELKYAIEDEATAHQISSTFPFRLTKSSKYVTGIDLIVR